MSKSPKKKRLQMAPVEAVEETAQAVEEAPKKKSFLASLAEKVAPVAKAVIPQVAGLIPGVGPILKGVLSTLNDDEWFSEFKSGGATFNELLGDIPICPGSDKIRSLTGALMVHEVSPLGEGSTQQFQYFKDMLLPTILAYVRDKTGDVLVSAEADYWEAFFNATCLLALYFTLEKYIELQHNLPINIPDLSSLCDILNPADYAAYVGIRDSLRDYLSVTIGLPHAWVEYLRWRFGTTFYSDNTGRAGLVMYDYNLRRLIVNKASWIQSGLTPVLLSGIIATYKAKLAATSRAVADLHLAYKDHIMRLNVEARHYDEKEYNLRCNVFNSIASRYKKDSDGGDLTSMPDVPGPLVYLDSRLDSSAAYQAVTLSTDSNDRYAPLHVTSQFVFWYTKADYQIEYPYYDSQQAPQTGAITMFAGWHGTYTWMETANKQQASSIKRVGVHVEYVGGPDFYRTEIDTSFTGTKAVSSGTTPVAINAAVTASILFAMGQVVQESLQGHKAQSVTQYVMGLGNVSSVKYIFVGKPLAYDMAIVTWSQIESTHRMAMRNLVRGNYSHKLSPATNPVVTEPVNDLVEVVADQMVDKAKEL